MQITALNLAPMNLHEIPLAPQPAKPEIVEIQERDGFFINRTKADDFRIRKPVYDMLLKARDNLPRGVFFMVFEAYRPLARQRRLWESVYKKLEVENPHASKEQLTKVCENFVANPYDGIGSGHQACCAIDITLCDKYGNEFDMGTAMHEFNEQTETACEAIHVQAKVNRRILVGALEKAGFINYPAEWWHFSYGDHQWAWLTDNAEALFGPIDI